MTEIREGGLDDPQVHALLAVHAAGMLANSPAESCHFLDTSALRGEDVRFWTLWEGDALVAMGALKALGDGTGEIKSMRTAAPYLGRGAGSALLRHIIAEARASGWSRLSLETGSSPAFEPAIRLYARHGFQPCAAFADYPADDPFSRFMTLAL